MLFDWETKVYGPVLVSARKNAGSVSVIIAWGKEVDGLSVEYRIENRDCEEEGQRLERATRLAMGHFERMACAQTGLINLVVDSTSKSFDGPLPAAVE